MGRDIIIGDVHGCLDEFQALTDGLRLEEDDRVLCLGDFMDRGPDSVGCVRHARSRGFRSIFGNHEDKHLKWRRREARRAFEPNFVNEMRPLSPEAIRDNALLSEEDVAWMKNLPTLVEFAPGWVAVHGGLFPGHSVEAQLASGKMRDRIVRLRNLTRDEHKYVPYGNERPTDHFWAEVWDGPVNVVYGHSVHGLERPRIDYRPQGVATYGIDTGCVYGGRLTALILENGVPSFFQVQASRAYATRAHV